MPISRLHIALTSLLLGCGTEATTTGDNSSCGPTTGTVVNIVDGDTVDLDSGDRIRYLMIDAPETTTGKSSCYGHEAAQANSELVLGRQVNLIYDSECNDRYGRLLAYIWVDDTEVNTRLVERGFACVLHIPPNGSARSNEFATLEQVAQAQNRGMWSVCEDVGCD